MIRLGVAGAGLIGRRHIAVIDQVPDVTLSAVLDPALRDDDPLPRAATLEALAKASDGVILAVPNALHAPMAVELLDLGTPILIEKPISDTVANGSIIADRAAQTGVPALIGHHRRYNPIIAKAKEVIDGGTLGVITAVHGQCWLPKPDRYYAAAWRQGQGAGPLLINLIHDVDLLLHLCGPIESVQAFEASHQRGTEAEEVSVAIARFASGALGTLNLSDVSLGPWSWELTAGENSAYPKTNESSYLIGGTHGSLAMPNLTVWSQEHGPDWWAPISTTRLPIAQVDPLAAQIAHFADVIEGTAPARVTVEDGLRALAVIEAIKTGARTGGTVRVS